MSTFAYNVLSGFGTRTVLIVKGLIFFAYRLQTCIKKMENQLFYSSSPFCREVHGS